MTFGAGSSSRRKFTARGRRRSGGTAWDTVDGQDKLVKRFVRSEEIVNLFFRERFEECREPVLWILKSGYYAVSLDLQRATYTGRNRREVGSAGSLTLLVSGYESWRVHRCLLRSISQSLSGVPQQRDSNALVGITVPQEEHQTHSSRPNFHHELRERILPQDCSAGPS